jgi:tetratricopeptide (TPR) repeat protein
LCLPLIGIVGPLIAILGNTWFPRRGDLPDSIVPVPHRELPERGAKAPCIPRLGAASAYGRLRHARTLMDRMDALIALRDIDDKSTIPVLKLALRDNADEVRLLAFTLLQERERGYYAEIHARKGKLADAGPEDAITHLTAIAQAYWELAYQDLVQGELLDFSLDEAGTHLARALKARPKDSGNTLLLGRIRLRQGSYPEAARLLDEARALGMPDAVVRPHQAEVAFLARDFGKTRAYLADLPPQARQLAVIGDLAEFWA